MIKLTIINNEIKTNDPKAYTLEKSSHFGKKIGNIIEYSPFEALYLIQNKKAKIFSSQKEMNLEKIEKKLNKIDKKFPTKYSVYKDLRQKGYIPKTALKFGADFRVYEKNKGPGKDHSKWIVFAEPEGKNHSWQEFSAKNRVANSTKKKLLLAIVDNEKDISYYEVSWKKI